VAFLSTCAAVGVLVGLEANQKLAWAMGISLFVLQIANLTYGFAREAIKHGIAKERYAQLRSEVEMAKTPSPELIDGIREKVLAQHLRLIPDYRIPDILERNAACEAMGIEPDTGAPIRPHERFLGNFFSFRGSRPSPRCFS
jgi:hypothetical protein